jgi:hypothetical protein
MRDVGAHRNAWFVGSLDKAERFANGERAEVVKQHPELAPAYGTLAAARKFAEKQFPGNTEDQARFVKLAQQLVTERIAHGDQVPAPKIREERQQRTDQEHRTPPPPRQKASEQDRAR